MEVSLCRLEKQLVSRNVEPLAEFVTDLPEVPRFHKAMSFVQRDASPLLTRDSRDNRAMPQHPGAGDQVPEQRAANPAPVPFGMHIDGVFDGTGVRLPGVENIQRSPP